MDPDISEREAGSAKCASTWAVQSKLQTIIWSSVSSTHAEHFASEEASIDTELAISRAIADPVTAWPIDPTKKASARHIATRRNRMLMVPT